MTGWDRVGTGLGQGWDRVGTGLDMDRNSLVYDGVVLNTIYTIPYTLYPPNGPQSNTIEHNRTQWHTMAHHIIPLNKGNAEIGNIIRYRY